MGHLLSQTISSKDRVYLSSFISIQHKALCYSASSPYGLASASVLPAIQCCLPFAHPDHLRLAPGAQFSSLRTFIHDFLSALKS